uniref:Serine/threonine-protein kinase PBS1 n=1 Tax=Cajanus cajan TaxID=3821 RepID=A0A151SU73_CAJCA|nr:Serine/threonine-protein kinase PBS1 [Cajanus cajan]
MRLQLIFLLIKLHFVICTPQFHEYAATNLHRWRIRGPSSIAFPPLESSSGVPASIGLPPSKASSRVPGNIPLSPSKSFFKIPIMKWMHNYVDSPISHHHKHKHKHKHHYSKSKSTNQVPGPIFPVHPHTHQGPPVFKSEHPFSSPMSWDFHAPAPAPAPAILSHQLNVPSPSPRISPLGPSLKKTKTPPPAYALVLPSPPPNKDCMSLTCSEPLTYTPPGSPCGCVWPLQVKLRISIAIYKFFPLVSELAKEIAASVSLNRNQVRIVEADAISHHQLEKTNVLINLVPQGVKFDETTAFLIYKKFWQREILNDASAFGAYEVLYVHYPGLPPSPPSNVYGIDAEPDPGRGNNGTMVKPFGVDVSRKKKEENGGRVVIMIVLTSFTVFVLFMGVAWLCLLKCSFCNLEPEQVPDVQIPSSSKQSGTASTRSLTYGSMPGSRSMSFSSGTIMYTGSAKIFTLNEIEKATNNFNSSRILGEGGFGLVYKGGLQDGRDVAVKILKRDDQHGDRQFFAEADMLSRLHHRNLVKLIGVCTEKQTRCLVYELVPNGSVESHLHGADKEIEPLDWDSRMKIALGAARGLAYLHEDCNPCVIHRDFKSSNILLEYDFTPKVSDFGLARTALNEGRKHIPTHVIGTFGYLAPEYAMTGHLLVKSQENLVAWARPFLTSKGGLQKIIDPVIKPSVSDDTMVKVAAIASMCVQPEAPQRPFMGEVVQALKLVCSEFEETSYVRPKGSLGDGLVTNVEGKFSSVLGERVDFSECNKPLPQPGYQPSREPR